MKTFKKNWNNRIVKDDGCYMSKEAKSFVTAMKNMLKRELAPYDINVLSLKPNHYNCSGFLEKDGYYVYISYSIPRYGDRINFLHLAQATEFFIERQKTKRILLADVIISAHWRTCQISFISLLMQELNEIRLQALGQEIISSAQMRITVARMTTATKLLLRKIRYPLDLFQWVFFLTYSH